MNNLSTANSTDITSQIGALELGGDPDSHSDGVLEAAGASMDPGPRPTAPRICGIPTLGCHIDDRALEFAAADMALGGPTSAPYGCFPTRAPLCIGDGALEAAGASFSPHPSMQCGGITAPPICRYIDDSALEAAGAYLNPPPQPTQARTGCGLPPTLVCHIDDGALEAVADKAFLGVTQNFCYPTKLGC